MVRTANSTTLNSRNYERTFKLQDLYHDTSSHYHHHYHLYHPQPRTLHTHQHNPHNQYSQYGRVSSSPSLLLTQSMPSARQPGIQKITYPILTASPRLGLNASEQREFQARMERKQMKEFMNVCLRLPLDSPIHHQPEQTKSQYHYNYHHRLSIYHHQCNR